MAPRTPASFGLVAPLIGVLFGANALAGCSSDTLPGSIPQPGTGGSTNVGGTGGAGGSATAGSTTGGSTTGGSTTGGVATGGSATGGSATGGSATGGTATGGSTTGGTTTGGGAGSGGGGPITTSICTTAAENAGATLTCPPGAVITSIDFASYGTPTGACGAFATASTCHAAQSESVVSSACLGQSSCVVQTTNANFGGDPCSFVVKNLSIQATCTGGTGGSGGMAGAGGTAGSGGTGGGAWNEGTELKAFPTAQGYGRYAKGGRGGRVIEVTNLNDSGPGSLRDAIAATGARTVVFRVGGVIELQSKLVIRKENNLLTVAAQTAPGKGIVVKGWTFGMLGGEDVVMRFVRTRVGSYSGVTMDGMGITSSNNCIYDHCSVSWTIDEAFSSRGSLNFTLQRTLISEALNDAGHEIQQAPHGYAASIGGDIGSFHHNLTAHCAGRNWSLAGGLIHGTLIYAGRLDIRNNVFYNWQNRTTDGGAHEVNFVANYYKPGPASEIFTALNPTNDGFEGTQRYYMAGNVMPGHFDESNQEDGRDPNGQPFPYEPFVNAPFFESYVATQSAQQAYEDVLANVGANVPMLDDHDKRIIEETRTGTARYRGSRTGLPGLPDNQEDVGGLESYPTVTHATNFDTDHDGMPDDWERAHGLNPSDAADGNGTNLSRLGYTNLEMYLNELAGDFR